MHPIVEKLLDSSPASAKDHGLLSVQGTRPVDGGLLRRERRGQHEDVDECRERVHRPHHRHHLHHLAQRLREPRKVHPESAQVREVAAPEGLTWHVGKPPTQFGPSWLYCASRTEPEYSQQQEKTHLSSTELCGQNEDCPCSRIARNVLCLVSRPQV